MFFIYLNYDFSPPFFWKIVEIENALMAPDEGEVAHYEEPLAEATILCPNEYVS